MSRTFIVIVGVVYIVLMVHRHNTKSCTIVCAFAWWIIAVPTIFTLQNYLDSHKSIEKRRRDRINNCLTILKSMVPDCRQYVSHSHTTINPLLSRVLVCSCSIGSQ